MTRLRTATFPWLGSGVAQRRAGGVPWFSQTQTTGGANHKHVCEDSLGRGGEHPMDISHDDRSGLLRLNGTRNIGSGEDKFYLNWVPGHFYAFAGGHNLGTDVPGIGDVAVMTMARSNPSRSYVSVPNFVYELRDLPRMLRGLGDIKSGKDVKDTVGNLANHNLAAQMGWKPLVSDIQKLSIFQLKVEQRLRDLDALFRKGGYTRRVRSSNWTSSVSNGPTIVTVESNLGDFIDCEKSSVTTVERWGSCRWFPANQDYNLKTTKEMTRYVHSLILGLNAQPERLWDAIPWTWMIDWFSNVGDYMAANANTVPAYSSTPCVMTRTKTVTTWRRVDGFKFIYTGGEGTSVYETLSRTIHPGFLSASLPHLKASQLSILGSLAIQRIK